MSKHKFIVSSSLLLSGVNTVKPAIPKGTMLPVMENFLFEVRKGELIITATNLEATIRTRIGVESSESFTFLIPAKKLIEILSSMEDQPLTLYLDTKEFLIEICNDYGKFEITTSDPEDFPAIPPHEAKGVFELSSESMRAIVSKVGFAQGSDELRPVMNGVYFDFSTDGLKAVATDAHKLAILSLGTKSSGQGFILPKIAVLILGALSAVGEEKLKFEYDDTQMEVIAGKTTLNVRLIEGKYPGYEAVLPKSETFLSVNRMDLLKSVKQALLMTNSTTYQVKLSITKDGLAVSGRDLDFNQAANIRLNSTFNGSDMEIGFNGKFLIDVLSRAENKDVRIGLSTPNRAAVIEENGNVLFLIMPVKLLDDEAPTSEEVVDKEQKEEVKE